MERELVALGVSEKVKDRARQTFEKSAEQAGFFRCRLAESAAQTIATAPRSFDLIYEDKEDAAN